MGRMKEVFVEDLERKEYDAEIRAANERIMRILESKDRVPSSEKQQGDTARITRPKGKN